MVILSGSYSLRICLMEGCVVTGHRLKAGLIGVPVKRFGCRCEASNATRRCPWREGSAAVAVSGASRRLGAGGAEPRVGSRLGAVAAVVRVRQRADGALVRVFG